MWAVKPGFLEVLMWEHDATDINGLNVLRGLFCQALDLPVFHVSCTCREFGQQHCGAAALVFLQHLLHHAAFPDSDSQLAYAADSLRDHFRFSHADTSVMPRPWCWGAGSNGQVDVLSLLATLLEGHGVPKRFCSSGCSWHFPLEVLEAFGEPLMLNLF